MSIIIYHTEKLINHHNHYFLLPLIDLTLVISPELPVFPGSPQPKFVSCSNIKNDGYNLEMLHLSSHTGTHIDAPYHFAEDGIKVDQIPIDRLFGIGVLIKSLKNSDSSITQDDIMLFEEVYGLIPDGSSVFFFTGWQKNLNYANDSNNNDYFTKNPGLDVSAANYLASKKINLVGIDSPSIDPGYDKSFSAHHIFSKENILIVENLANLENISSLNFDFAILPLNLQGATGSPVRAVAL